MFIEKRPTCVSVIGWAWIVLGGGMCASGIMALVVFTLLANENPVPHIEYWFPFLAVIQICFAITGLISGIRFLKLKASSRPVLETLSWILLVYAIGFLIFWQYAWITQVPVGNEPVTFKWLGVVMSLVVSTIYLVPLGIMLRYLRGDKIRRTMRGSRQS